MRLHGLTPPQAQRGPAQRGGHLYSADAGALGIALGDVTRLGLSPPGAATGWCVSRSARGHLLRAARPPHRESLPWQRRYDGPQASSNLDRQIRLSFPPHQKRPPRSQPERCCFPARDVHSAHSPLSGPSYFRALSPILRGQAALMRDAGFISDRGLDRSLRLCRQTFVNGLFRDPPLLARLIRVMRISSLRGEEPLGSDRPPVGSPPIHSLWAR